MEVSTTKSKCTTSLYCGNLWNSCEKAHLVIQHGKFIWYWRFCCDQLYHHVIAFYFFPCFQHSTIKWSCLSSKVVYERRSKKREPIKQIKSSKDGSIFWNQMSTIPSIFCVDCRSFPHVWTSNHWSRRIRCCYFFT